jgi:hypothetical protein
MTYPAAHDFEGKIQGARHAIYILHAQVTTRPPPPCAKAAQKFISSLFSLDLQMVDQAIEQSDACFNLCGLSL